MNPQVAEFLPPDQEILQEVLVYFLGEVREHLSALRQGFQDFCKGESERLLDLHHSVHTLKGSSSTVGLVHFSSYVRRLESAMRTFKDPHLQATTMLETHLLATLDCLQMQIDAIQRDSRENLNLQSVANRVFEQLESHLHPNPVGCRGASGRSAGLISLQG
jgi:chemotaxis protein histidine kinase CheA